MSQAAPETQMYHAAEDGAAPGSQVLGALGSDGEGRG